MLYTATDTAALDSPELQDRVDDWIEHYEYLWKSQTRALEMIERNWLRWAADPYILRRLRDPDLRALDGLPPLKRWQTVLATPRGAINELARTTAMANLIAETRPLFATRGFQADDLAGERPIESLMDYMLGILNPAIEWVSSTFTRAFVQGTALLEARWVSEYYELDVLPRRADVRHFQQQMKAAMAAIEQDRAVGGNPAAEPPGILPDGSMDEAAFAPEAWGATMRRFAAWAAIIAERYGVQVPEPPHGSRQKVAQHVGIKIAHLEAADLTYDPMKPSFRDQPRLYKRMVMDKDAAVAACKRQNEIAIRQGRVPPFLLDRIEALEPGITAMETQYEHVGRLQESLLRVIGYEGDQARDPSAERKIEVLEVWEPRAGDQYRWCWIGQRKTPLTRGVAPGRNGRLEGVFPFSFAEHPFVAHFHIQWPGRTAGLSGYHYESARHEFLDEQESLLADMFKLAAGPPLQRIGGYGVEGRAEIEPAPFSVIVDQSDDPVQYKPLFEFSRQLEAGVAAIRYHKGEIDLAHGVNEMTRGETAPPRLAVGVEQNRAQGQQNRPRHEMYRFAAMCCRDLAPLVALQTWQFGDDIDVDNITGVKNPLEMMLSANLKPAFSQNYLTMPAAVMAEAALAIQQLQETIKLGSEIGVLVPAKRAALLAFRELMRSQRMQIAADFLSAATQDLQEADQTQQAQAQAQQQVQELQGQLGALRAEADALRVKMGLLTAAQSEAALAAIVQSGGQGGPPALPPGQPEVEGAPPGTSGAPEPPRLRFLPGGDIEEMVTEPLPQGQEV